jgi:Raf kinase inhibitor-like YbhB/YbcL family protein
MVNRKQFFVAIFVELVFVPLICVLGLAVPWPVRAGDGPTATVRVQAGSVSFNPSQGARNMAFAMSSMSFPQGGDIPRKFTCDGADVSPELSWTEPPAGTQSFALIADDPDAPGGTWTHWVLFDLPPTTRNLPEGVSKIDELPGGARQGRNDFRKIGYNGPCPPPGKPHRYFFKLYALDRKLDLKPAISKPEVEQAMQGHTLGKAEYVGKYQR